MISCFILMIAVINQHISWTIIAAQINFSLYLRISIFIIHHMTMI